MTWLGIVCGPYIDLGRNLLTTSIIRREYARTHEGKECQLQESDFSIEDRSLSLDAFSRKQGWMQ